MTTEFNNTRRSNFIGHDGFVWWVGIVESRQDPLNLGRCQVRIKGLHSDKKSDIPTTSLPWAQPMFPTNVSNMTATTLVEGDMVIGFFFDGDAAQFPIIMGKFHGIPEDATDINSGFNDPRTAEQLKSAPRKPKSINFNTSGSGATIQDNTSGVNYPENLNEPTIDRLVRNESISNTIVKSKTDSIVSGINTASGASWSEPKTPYNAKYPYNHVLNSESGHYMEFDDTPSAERVHVYHRSGTFSETHPDGSHVNKIVKNKYTIVMGEDDLYVMGDCNITVQGNCNVYVKKDCNLKVDGTLTETIAKDLNIKVSGNMNIDVAGSIKQSSQGLYNTGNIYETGMIITTGDVIAAGISVDFHVHSDESGTTGTPV